MERSRSNAPMTEQEVHRLNQLVDIKVFSKLHNKEVGFGEFLYHCLLTQSERDTGVLSAAQVANLLTADQKASIPAGASGADPMVLKSAAGGAKTLFDIDLASLDTLDLKAGGDGSVSIGGYDFDVFNSLNSATFGIVNGAGLQYSVVPGDSPNSNIRPTSDFTGPMLKKTLADIPEYDPAMKNLELTCKFNSVVNADCEQLTMGIASNFSGGIHAWQVSIARRWEAEQKTFARWGQTGGPDYYLETAGSETFLRMLYFPAFRRAVFLKGELGVGDTDYPSTWTFVEAQFQATAYKQTGFRSDAVLFFAFSNQDGGASNDYTASYERIRARLF